MSLGHHMTLPARCKSVIDKGSDSNYRPNCPPYEVNGRKFTSGSTPWANEIHHILCEHAISDFDDTMGPEKLEYIRDCLCDADWDINDKNNLIGLPEKSVYVNSRGTTPVNLPCHTIDHNTADGYTNEVLAWLHSNIWESLTITKSNHQMTPTTVKQLLDETVDHFKGELKRRGKRSTGTTPAYANRFESSWEQTWYLPFSMANDGHVRERSPGGRGNLPIFDEIK